jgi:hypothetical protein
VRRDIKACFVNHFNNINVRDVGARGRGKDERREKKKGEVNSEDSVVNCVLSSQTDFNDRRCLLWCPSHNQKSGALEGVVLNVNTHFFRDVTLLLYY